MRSSYILGLLLAFCSGCVWHRSCQVTSATDSTTVELRKNWYGLVPGICGLTTHASYDYKFKLPDHKTEYNGSEIQELPVSPIEELPAGTIGADSYGGKLTIFRDQKRVVVDLSEYGHPFELNGTYHYP